MIRSACEGLEVGGASRERGLARPPDLAPRDRSELAGRTIVPRCRRVRGSARALTGYVGCAAPQAPAAGCTSSPIVVMSDAITVV
jgi:hypothetical protein